MFILPVVHLLVGWVAFGPPLVVQSALAGFLTDFGR